MPVADFRRVALRPAAVWILKVEEEADPLLHAVEVFGFVVDFVHPREEAQFRECGVIVDRAEFDILLLLQEGLAFAGGKLVLHGNVFRPAARDELVVEDVAGDARGVGRGEEAVVEAGGVVGPVLIAGDAAQFNDFALGGVEIEAYGEERILGAVEAAFRRRGAALAGFRRGDGAVGAVLDCLAQNRTVYAGV